MHGLHHARSSVAKWGGSVNDYLIIHQWFDQSRSSHGDFRHRAMRHHAEGIAEAERVFGTTITNSAGKVVPVRYIGEQHVREDCGGRIPTFSDWVACIAPKRWMNTPSKSAVAAIVLTPEPGEERS